MRRRHALLLVDDALVLARDAGARGLARALWPSLGLSWLALIAYGAERVEGYAGLRPYFAALAVGLWMARAFSLGALSLRSVRRLIPRDDLPLSRRSPRSVLTSSAWSGALTLICAAPAALLARTEPFWAVLVAPPLWALGAVWSGRMLTDALVSAAPPGLPTLRASARRLEGQRMRVLGAQLLLGAAGLVLAFNLGAAASAILSLSQDVLGFDLALLRAFVAPSNVFVSLFALGLAQVAIDALRAALAALLFAEDLARAQAFALRDAVDAALRTRPGQADAPAVRRALGIALLGLALAGSAQAEVPPPRRTDAPHAAAQAAADDDASCDLFCGRARTRDADAATRIGGILRRPEFRSFELAPDSPRGGEPDWLRTVFVWIDRLVRRRSLAPAVPDRVQVLLLPSAWVFLAAAGLVTLFALLVRFPQRALSPAPPGTPQQGRDMPAERVEGWLREAQRLADADPHAAMRCVFLGVLAALAERGLLPPAAHQPNARLEAILHGGPFQALFARLRHDFERSAYGAESPSAARVRAHAGEVQRLFSLSEVP